MADSRAALPATVAPGIRGIRFLRVPSYVPQQDPKSLSTKIHFQRDSTPMNSQAMVLCTLGCMLLRAFSVSAQTTRPVRDEVGFCWDSTQMARLVTYLEQEIRPDTDSRTPIAGISPHDDYLYAGKVYGPLFRMLRAKEVVIFGVTHGTVRREIGDPRNVLILETFERWRGVFHPVPVSPLRDSIRASLDARYFIVSNRAHELEHSVEALVPFLQYYNPDIRITPVMVTGMPLERMDEVAGQLSTIIAQYIRRNGLVPGRDIVFLISSDANHYGVDFNNTPFGEDEEAHRRGTELDRQIAACMAGPLDSGTVRTLTAEIWGASYSDPAPVVWCGKYSIPFGLLVIQKTMRPLGERNLEGRILNYSDTYSG